MHATEQMAADANGYYDASAGAGCPAWEQWHRPPLTAANDNNRLPKVVALTGAAGSGKSTVADHLVTRYGYQRIKFAGPLKAMCRAIGLTDEQIDGREKELPLAMLCGRSPRYFMQRLGTEFGRDLIGEEFWTGFWERSARAIIASGGRVVTDDCRFPNEAEVVMALGGTIFAIQGRGGISGTHASEAGIEADSVLTNNGTIGDLYHRVNEALFAAG